jgi:murein DD-endopeptidase MepM/ murein hydrolase activator NlpD
MKLFFITLLLIISSKLEAQFTQELIARHFFHFCPVYVADKIAYPVNHGSMDGYYDANPFLKPVRGAITRHLGADINGIIDGNSDLGDTIYSIGNGKVIYLMEMNWHTGAKGSIIMILHKTRKGYIVSLYRHCLESFVKEGQYVSYLQPISRIGNDGGLYLAHLHFEIRTNILKGVGYGYEAGMPQGYVDPIKFIRDFNTKY